MTLYYAVICTSKREFKEISEITTHEPSNCVYLNPLEFRESEERLRGKMFDGCVRSSRINNIPKAFIGRLEQLEKIVEDRTI